MNAQDEPDDYIATIERQMGNKPSNQTRSSNESTDSLPFECPSCECIEAQVASPKMYRVCVDCGYVYDGDQPANVAAVEAVYETVKQKHGRTGSGMYPDSFIQRYATRHGVREESVCRAIDILLDENSVQWSADGGIKPVSADSDSTGHLIHTSRSERE